jgi:hypothetical protein
MRIVFFFFKYSAIYVVKNMKGLNINESKS